MKNKILNLLTENNNKYISGEGISSSIGISRAAVWKYINALKEEGYVIESSTKKGYRLISTPDLLTHHEINKYLHTTLIGRNLVHFPTINSTNIKAKELCESNIVDGLVVVSEEQTAGKGRLGRSWLSPKGKGIWMSIILKPEISPMNASKITIITAAAVHKALSELAIDALIKWPNDIILNNKKVCGILTEMNGELNKINYLIVGVGINVNSDTKDLPDELKEKASSLLSETGRLTDRKKLMASILNNFEVLYFDFLKTGSFSSSINICRNNSAVINKDIFLQEGNSVKQVKVLDISNEGHLIIDENGVKKEVFSGEVSIRGLDKYI